MKIHFISIGGSVMHQLAIALHKKGYEITGSDDDIFEPSRSNLHQYGLLPAKMGWDPSAVHPGLDAVILGMHARENNPELQKARELGLPIYSFPEYIYQESINKKRIAVGGSHGKTTTTAMIMHILRKLGKDFDYLVGARLEGFEQSVSVTEAPLMVCEADEYPASALQKVPKFHFLHPHIAVLTGIAWDHINVFPTYDLYFEQFQIFLEKLEPGGKLIYNGQDPELNRLVRGSKRVDLQFIPYEVPAHTIEAGQTFLLSEHNGQQLRTPIQVFGAHNLMNLEAAWLVVNELGVTREEYLLAIQDFSGAAKRLEKLADNGSVVVYRDFAHAPSKVQATVQAVVKQFPEKEIVAVFELHTYSSLSKEFLTEYKGSMDNLTRSAVLFSAHALEIKKMPPLDPAWIREGFGAEQIKVCASAKELEGWLENQPRENTVYLFMSSGNFDGLNILTFAGQFH